MKTSNDGLKFIANEEGFVDHVYLCPAGVPTIGYGHVVRPGETRTKVTKEEALELLGQDVRATEDTIAKLVRVPLTQSQFDALVSLVFNIGGGAFAKSTLLRLLNAGDYGLVTWDAKGNAITSSGAAGQFLVWRLANGVPNAILIGRRKREARMYMTPDQDTAKSTRDYAVNTQTATIITLPRRNGSDPPPDAA